jgi:hypothetical protein
MLKWLKLSQHIHSGKIRPHEHTSYIPLGLILIITGVALSVYSANAATPYNGPESSSISLTGTMPGKAPTVASKITAPVDQQHFSTSPITISGTCPKDTLVEIYKTDIFAGSTTCTDAETFSIDIDMLIGKNVLIAKVYDALNQPGPDSNTVEVYYDALPAQAGALNALNFGGAQMLLNTDAVFRGVFPDKEMNVPINILGGLAPYAVNIQWGDATNKVVARNDNTTFSAGHSYTKPGTYQINVQATDSSGRVAFLSVAAIVNGQPSPTSIASSSDKLQVLWPIYAVAVAVVLSFWVGERREKRVLKKHGLLSYD